LVTDLFDIPKRPERKTQPESQKEKDGKEK
jgi:hypothetical protein